MKTHETTSWARKTKGYSKMTGKEGLALERVKQWLHTYGWTLIPNPRTYRGYDILAKDKKEVLKKIEEPQVLRRSY